MTEEIREALKKDFRKLYVKEFTTNWETVRLIREVEIDVMSLDNLEALLAKPQQPEQEVCPRCEGEKKVDTGIPLGIVTCPVCHGTGRAAPDRASILEIIGRILLSEPAYLGYDKGFGVVLDPFVDELIALFNPDEIRREE